MRRPSPNAVPLHQQCEGQEETMTLRGITIINQQAA